VSLYLVRHADSVGRHHWKDDDTLRPLSEKGRAQARGLVDALDGRRIDTIVSSPAVRCTQTVAEVAEDRGLTIVEDPALWEAMPLPPVRRLVDELDHAVLCSHGDLIPDLVDHLIAEGMEAVGRDCKKASVWILERDGARFVRGTYLPPPRVEG
jgi:broad specificity phosphatase PhoE